MPAPVTSVDLRAGQKTQILWSSLIVRSYQVTFSVGGVRVEWERNSSLPPFHTWGDHPSSAAFTAWVAGAYCNFWMTSPVDMTVALQ